jgi:hypothetical protein
MNKFTLKLTNLHTTNIVVSLDPESFIINIFSMLTDELVYTTKNGSGGICTKGPLVNPKRLTPNETIIYEIEANCTLARGKYKAIIYYRMDARLLAPDVIMFEIL